jgi:hypothetical protein
MKAGWKDGHVVSGILRILADVTGASLKAEAAGYRRTTYDRAANGIGGVSALRASSPGFGKRAGMP